MRFRVLGPLEVRAARGSLVPLRAAKQRTLLAALLLRPNRLVSTDRLLSALWAERPPRSATSVLRTYVCVLRQKLGLSDTVDLPDLASLPGGYRLRVDGGDLDSLIFEREASAGRQALARGDPAAAVDRLQRALGLWRGRALEDVLLDGYDAAELARLAEHQLVTQEAWIDARLRLGQHRDLVAELGSLVVEHPLRERLWAQWMLALYRCGRQAEALGAFRRLRAHLVAELGVEPGPPLQRLHGQILAGDPALELRAGTPQSGATTTLRPPVPRQLPPDVSGFAGRAAELSALRAPKRPPPGSGSGSGPTIFAINGGGGIGKSALVIHAAHRLARRFPAGQLYADLQGAAPGVTPITPLVVLGRFLRALGADDRDIVDLDEAAARFRAASCGRRLLVVLDNARDAAQVRPLLPASPTCLVLVTSRHVLASLDGAVHRQLDVLSPAEAMLLLHRLSGRQPGAATDPAAQRVVQSCAYLPLAVRNAAARLATRPQWSIQMLADRLADPHRRLDELQVDDDMGVRDSFRASVQLLGDSHDAADRSAADAFGLLGLLDGADFSLRAAARLLDIAEPAAERIIERLVDTRLVDSAEPGRYRVPELLRLFARESLDGRLPPAARAVALTRLWNWYAAAAWRAYRMIRPGEPGGSRRDSPALAGPSAALAGPAAGVPAGSAAAVALRWLDAERANLVAAVRQAAGTDGVPADVVMSLVR
ncbi:MAG TPA: BTAD domain-containing putative transcriptional regulator, partial [Pilimelia sp.]|nr:BTAD domain-containing putative transcriptional regulator [Pilimelia sp.]